MRSKAHQTSLTTHLIKPTTFIASLTVTLTVLCVATAAQARDQIRIVGSSTVYPFATVVAENFGRTTQFKTPVVESTGSGGGLRLFCAGVDMSTPDIANASRRIKKSEVDLCEKNGVEDIVEVKIGFDGIVIANTRKSPRRSFSKEQIFLALAREVPVAGKMVPNPYKKWSDIDPSLPAERIEVLGPPPTSGTRDAFVELAMEGGAKKIPMLKELRGKDKKAFKAIAHSIREDGYFVEAGENDNLLVQKIQANPAALAIFGFSFLDQNSDRIQGSLIEGVEPSFENIASGKYGVSRSLFFYVKKAHVGKVPGLEEYLAEFTSDRATGNEGYLADKGLIPLSSKERKIVQANTAKLDVLEM